MAYATTAPAPGQPEHRKGNLVHVLRHADGIDCTHGGLSSQHSKFVLIDPAQPELCPIFQPREATPPLYVARWYGRVIACPEDLYTHIRRLGLTPGRDDSNIDSLYGWMFGGNFVYTSDSRFAQLNQYPIPVYDRKEG